MHVQDAGTMAGVRAIAKRMLERIRAFEIHHRLVNRDTLTVAMFHRVLPADQLAGAPSDYAISDTLFRQCLGFFRRHYHPVGLEAVLAARRGLRPLPPRALLVTFDDGWADNLTVAAPLLAAAAMPAVVFVSSNPLLDPAPLWWQETLSTTWQRGEAARAALWAAIPASPEDAADDFLSLLRHYAALPPETRSRALAPFTATTGEGRQMLTPASLRTLADGAIAIGAHGASHLPLTRVADPGADLDRSRQEIEQVLGRPCLALSFPHGRYSAPIARIALDLGFQALFTSDAILNRLDRGRVPPLIGRIEIPPRQITAADGGLSSHRMAGWMFLRPRRALAAPPPSGAPRAGADLPPYDQPRHGKIQWRI